MRSASVASLRAATASKRRSAASCAARLRVGAARSSAISGVPAQPAGEQHERERQSAAARGMMPVACPRSTFRSRTPSAARATRIETYGVRVYIGDVKDPNTGIFDGSRDRHRLRQRPRDVAVRAGAPVRPHRAVEHRAGLSDHRQRVKPGAPPEVHRRGARLRAATPRATGCSCCTKRASPIAISGSATGAAPTGSICRPTTRPASCRRGTSCRSTGHPRIEPLAIPAFTPHRFYTRYAF